MISYSFPEALLLGNQNKKSQTLSAELKIKNFVLVPRSSPAWEPEHSCLQAASAFSRGIDPSAWSAGCDLSWFCGDVPARTGQPRGIAPTNLVLVPKQVTLGTRT
ncbi:MAG: hypothetical protein DRH26_13975 [Deltaproteobacteria bacterium]|nr:MAG: hypothetical protein DRH26_13975 [Deltaproteobacteria bacterium]